MIIYFYLLVFIFGCIIGSFLHVIIDRIPRGESVIKRRSHCEHCRRNLSWTDLIPVISFFLLRGKCRYCGRNISLYYPIIEIITGATFSIIAFMLFKQDFSLLTDIRYILIAIFYFLIISTLIIIFFIDLKFGIIPFQFVSFIIILTVLWYVFFPMQSNFLNYLLAAAGCFVFFFLIFFFTKGKGLGFGDVVYVFSMGLLLGYPNIIVGLYVTFLTGACISLILVLTGKRRIKGTVPFGPFLVFGTIIGLFWGNFITDTVIHYLIGA